MTRIVIHNHFHDARDEDDPCWEGYEQRGTKEKNGRTVPNCVEVGDGFTSRGKRGKIVRGHLGRTRPKA